MTLKSCAFSEHDTRYMFTQQHLLNMFIAIRPSRAHEWINMYTKQRFVRIPARICIQQRHVSYDMSSKPESGDISLTQTGSRIPQPRLDPP